ncbi:hypothetical protein [Shewanella salipaludis]|uniref:Uncharacterized protein n=1 Tax=Shewanella salipaludis TaxID=2723052 RepID=A0A972G2A1_9GAMM|nr:hypothetical protein [Shewanella salipaludis]NMH67022.1 hypothetical protein [Shewanella salipaludis]
MNNFKAKILIGILAILGSQAYAAGSDYKCTIDRYSVASGDEGDVYEAYKKLYLGKVFTVERNSGLMAGALKNSHLTEPQVIDHGSAENSYKVVATMRKEQGVGAGSNIYSLTINEYEKSHQKSFVFLRNDEVFFGVCVSY